MEEDIKILEEYLDKQDRKNVSWNRFKFLTAIENVTNRLKENETVIKEKDNYKHLYCFDHCKKLEGGTKECEKNIKFHST